MKIKFYILLKIPLSKFDYERFNIKNLEKLFDLKILDCSEFFKFDSNRDNDFENASSIIKIKKLKDLKSNLKSKGGYVLDFVGQFHPKAILLLNWFIENDTKIIAYDTVPVVNPRELIKNKASFFEKIIYMFKNNVFKRHFLALINKFLLIYLPNQDPFIALTSGTSYLNDPRFYQSKLKIKAHSLDYEKYLNIKNKKNKKLNGLSVDYAVYIDENITGHQDNVEMSLSQPTYPENFFPKLETFFNIIEKNFGMKVVIASYPVGKNIFKDYLKNKSFKNVTPELIKNSKLVLVHATTSISFAVLWNKPILFLTNDQIKKSWYGDFIKAPAHFLKSPLINIDNIRKRDLILSVKNNNYNEYKENYIKSSKSPEISVWQILYRTLKGI